MSLSHGFTFAQPFLGIVATLMLGGCPEPCSKELMREGAYRATILGPYGEGTRFPGFFPFTPGAAPSCESFDGLREETAVTLQAAGVAPGRACDALTATIIEVPPSITIEQPSHFPATAALISGAAAVSAGGCRGVWTVQFVRTPGATGSDFDQPVEGKMPVMVLLRTFSPDVVDAKCRTCFDFFTVKLETR
jgi:hypothetical protein